MPAPVKVNMEHSGTNMQIEDSKVAKVLDAGEWTGIESEECTGSPVISEGDEIVIRRTKAVVVGVPLEINKCRVEAVVDKGTLVTVLSDKVYSSIPAADRPKLRKD